MSSHFAVLASLALAIFFSPETLVLGLIIAGDKKVPRASAFAYAVGGLIGIAFATGIGLTLANVTGVGAHASHHGWPGFLVRVAISLALLSIGVRRAINAMRHRPIPDVTETGQKPSRIRAELTRRFPSLDLNADLPARQRIGRAGLAGFAMCGLHPKVFPIAIAAGHQIVQISRPGEKLLGIIVFAVISAIPALLPAMIDVIKPGATVAIKESYERIMKVHGRWIGAVLLIGAGVFVGVDAWRDMPGR